MHDISSVALLPFPDSEAEPVPSLPDSLIRVVPLTQQYQNHNPASSQALLPLAANTPRLWLHLRPDTANMKHYISDPIRLPCAPHGPAGPRVP